MPPQAALQMGEPVPAPGQAEADAAIATATGLAAERAAYAQPGVQGLAADQEVFDAPGPAAASDQHAGAAGAAKPSNTAALFNAVGATMKAIAGKVRALIMHQT